MKRIAKKHARRAPSERLVRLALRLWMTDPCWDAIGELQRRGSPAMLASARALARSPSSRKRALGLYVSAQLRIRSPDSHWVGDPYAVEETQALLLAGLRDAHTEVVRAAVSGLGHRPHASALEALVDLSRHAQAHLRWDVAVTLASYRQPA